MVTKSCEFFPFDYESPVYAETQLESILGILYSIFAQCTVNLTVKK
jgi:hypothetical protein